MHEALHERCSRARSSRSKWIPAFAEMTTSSAERWCSIGAHHADAAHSHRHLRGTTSISIFGRGGLLMMTPSPPRMILIALT